MLVHRGFSRISPEATALTVGNFDGVHRGHRALLARTLELARQDGLRASVITFEPHPREYFSAHRSARPARPAPARLSTLREKLERMAEENIEQVYVAHFNASFAALSAEDFVSDILLARLRVRRLVIGDDFCFGKEQRGNLALLHTMGEEHGFSVESVPSVRVGEQRVSSSAVRAALSGGNMDHAAKLLGHPYSIDGRVVHGQKMGRQLGFATANLKIKHEHPVLTGVFAVEVFGLSQNSPIYGVANLGFRPTLDPINAEKSVLRPLLEVHLFDFSDDIYGAHLSVRFCHKLRSEMKFSNLDALKAQIALDAQNARRFFKY